MMGGPGGGSVNSGNAISKKEKQGAAMKLVKLMMPHLPIMILCALLCVALNLADLFKPYIMAIAVDDFITVYAGKGMEYVNEATKGANWFTGTLLGLGVSYFLLILGGQVAVTVYRVPELMAGAKVILDLPQSDSLTSVRITLNGGMGEVTVFQGEFPANASRHPEVELKAQEAGDYTYRVYFNEKFAYQHQVTLK